MKKRIALDQLRPGMYLIGMDQSWWNTPFLKHHRLIQSEQEILQLKQSGVKQVEIDPLKGLDVESSADFEESAVDQLQDSEKPMDEEQSSPDSDGETTRTQTSSEFPSAPLGSYEQDSDVDQQLTRDLNEEAVAGQVRDAAIQAVEKIFEGVVTGVPIDYPLLQDTAQSVVQHITAHPRSMSQLVLLQNLRAFDKHVYSHVVDVCALTVVIGIELGWSEVQLHELGIGALLHDIGYMRLPANLLRQRQSGLEPDVALLSQHAELGSSLLKQCSGVPNTVCRLVQEHHERLDGSGAPTGLRGSAIASASQLIGLLDRFDSMTSHWGGGSQKSSAQVLRELYGEAKAGQFDVNAVERMIRCFGIYPVGSFVELSTKERGFVTMIHPDDLLKPVIKVISDDQGTLYPSPFLVNLADAKEQPHRTIKGILDPAIEGFQVGKYFPLVGAPS